MHIVYYPQIGCQIALPFDDEKPLEDQINIEGLEYQVREVILSLTTQVSYILENLLQESANTRAR